MHLDRLTLPGDVSDIRLRAAVTARLESHQQQIFPTGIHRDSQQQLALFVNRLSSRLGRHLVLRSGLAPDAQPEYAVWSKSAEIS